MDSQLRQALVAYLATRFGATGSLGKKAVQKYVHILSSVTRRNVGYDFSFYTYGPFSRELASDLDLLATAKAISIAYDGDAYSITATEGSADLVKLLPGEVKELADTVWAQFEGRTAKQLELISTILFVRDNEHLGVAGREMADRVKALKPKYSIGEISKAQNEVSAL